MSDLVATYEAVLAANFCGVAVVTLLTFDWVISLGCEINLIWRNQKRSASLLYVFNRYCVMLEWFLGIITIQRVSDLVRLYWTEVVLGLLSMLGPALFSALRVYALSGKHRALTGLTFGLALIPIFVNVSTEYQSHPVNIDPPYNCSLDSTTSPSVALTVTFVSRSTSTLADLIAIAVTWRATYRSSRLASETIDAPTFHQILLHNGSVYFVVLATLNILHILMTALSFKVTTGSESYVINFIDPIASILVCRFLISLQEAERYSHSESEATHSFVAPNFSVGPASQVSSFAAPLGGLLHTSDI
ncbi:hypothetical protein L226DRAFT_146660 [Lentinus tigrinus ALCF2SS1-7]|uniref:uncharacterized protein n=1 Tax=Lentinus tigrinus ALCF2SS1-7 TaxID=1328758 RepID=UPI00116636B2|nr:hypothetical protein L226DRAFT_146660 [Lentinus tigrinus ALCF2SS1-7]